VSLTFGLHILLQEGGSEGQRGRDARTGTGQESRWRSSRIFSRLKEQSPTGHKKRPRAGVRPPMLSAAMPARGREEGGREGGKEGRGVERL